MDLVCEMVWVEFGRGVGLAEGLGLDIRVRAAEGDRQGLVGGWGTRAVTGGGGGQGGSSSLHGAGVGACS